MSRTHVRLLLGALCAALVLGLAPATAQAAATPRVYGVARAGQDWYQGKLLVRWRAVRSASYQLRWAATSQELAAAPAVSTRTSAGTWTTRLDRSRPWLVQVRAVRSGRPGPWSATRSLGFQQGWPGAISLRTAGLPGQVRFTWDYSPFASRYRVLVDAARFGAWPGPQRYAGSTSEGWVDQYARTQTFTLPGRPAPGDQLLAVDYANPVFARLEAVNEWRAGARFLTPWRATYATPPTPEAGDPVRLGSYNVQLAPTSGARITAIAANIDEHRVDVVALQEATPATADALVRRLGARWARAPHDVRGIAQQVLYRNDRYRVLQAGSFPIRNSGNLSRPLETPWVRLQHVSPRQPSRQQSFRVISVHLAPTPGASRTEANRETGIAARELLAASARIQPGDEPTLLAGDLQYGREPFGEAPDTLPAQPVLVRDGYYDTLAATTQVGSAYSTFNAIDGVNQARQVANASGVGPRPDHILVRGFRGAARYENVHSWSYGGLVPSDHNLLIADVMIPFRSP